MAASTNLHFAEIGMAYRQVQAIIARAFADRTIWVAEEIVRLRLGQCFPSPFRAFRLFRVVRVTLPTQRTGGDLFQCLFDLFAHRVLSPASGAE